MLFFSVITRTATKRFDFVLLFFNLLDVKISGDDCVDN